MVLLSGPLPVVCSQGEKEFFSSLANGWSYVVKESGIVPCITASVFSSLRSPSSLLVRDLSGIVKESDIVTSEHMVTLVVVVSKFAEKEWLQSYETLSNFVVSAFTCWTVFPSVEGLQACMIVLNFAVPKTGA